MKQKNINPKSKTFNKQLWQNLKIELKNQQKDKIINSDSSEFAEEE